MSNSSLLEKLFLESSLYEDFIYEPENIEEIVDIFVYPSNCLKFDCYCIGCKKESTFAFYRRDYSSYGRTTDDKIIEKYLHTGEEPKTVIYQCQRNSNHKYSFSFLINNSRIMKVGQYPSLASIEIADIQKYRKVLKQDYSDFSKAIGLYSHGIGIGSFVYLRRIFENLIEEKRQEKSKETGWNEVKFQGSKMEEKIKILEDSLPDVLVENRRLYGIISNGIHQLNEEDCLKLFPDVKLAIELILDEKIYLEERRAKIKRVGSFVSSTVDKLKGKPD